jgi:hypothetical protein
MHAHFQEKSSDLILVSTAPLIFKEMGKQALPIPN